MSEPTQSRQVIDFAANLLRSIAMTTKNPFFIALRDGSLTLEQFRLSQEQFYFAVEFFPRPMAALVGRIPEPALRLDILRNLVEEHGEFNESHFHKTTFRKFLKSIHSSEDILDNLAPWPCMRAFNSVLTTSCVLDELEVGVACMGIIEYAFATCSAAIGSSVVARQWIAATDLVHYRLHAQIDERHAQEFFNVIEPRWSDPSRQYFIKQGLELGAYIFDRLYRDLHQAATSSAT